MIVPLAFIVCGILLLVVGFMADVWVLRIIAGATIGAAGLPLIVMLCRNYWSYGTEERRACDEARIVYYNPSYSHHGVQHVAVISNTGDHIQQIVRTL